MKNPVNIFISDKVKNGEAELVKFSGYIAYVDVSNENRVRVCFRADTADKDAGLVSVVAWVNSNGKGPDWKKIITEDKKGRYAVALAVHTSNDGYENYTLTNIDFAPAPKN